MTDMTWVIVVILLIGPALTLLKSAPSATRESLYGFALAALFLMAVLVTALALGAAFGGG